MMRKFSTIVVITLVLGLLATACGAAPTPAPAAATPTPVPLASTAAPRVLKVGVLGPFTGPNARVGEEFQGSVTMAFEAIDWTIGDYTIELVWIDSESDSEKATLAYEAAILRDKIDVGILNWQTWVAAPCMDVVAKHHIPHFFGFGAGDIINEKYHSDPEKYSYWLGKTWPTPGKLSEAYIVALEEAIAEGLWEPGEKTVALCSEDTDWGRSYSEALKANFEEAGWNVVSSEVFPFGETEFYPLLNKIVGLKPAVVAGSMNRPEAFVKQAREIKLNSLLIIDGLGWVGEWYELTGEASDYVIDQIPQWTTDEAKAFKDEFEERQGFPVSPSAGGLAYDATNFFIEIAKATYEEYGELSRETLYEFGREKLITGEFTYTDGILMEELKFTPESMPDPVVGEDGYIFPVIQYFGGEGTIVWPPSWKEADLKIPPWYGQW